MLSYADSLSVVSELVSTITFLTFGRSSVCIHRIVFRTPVSNVTEAGVSILLLAGKQMTSKNESIYLRNKIFLSVFYRAIKHGSELRCVEIEITRPKAEWFNFKHLNDYPCFIAWQNTNRNSLFPFQHILSSEKRQFITKIRGVSSDIHDVITAWVFYHRIIHGDVDSLFI